MEETTDIGLLWHSANGEWCIAKNLIVSNTVKGFGKSILTMNLYFCIKTPCANLGYCSHIFCTLDATKIILLVIGERLVISAPKEISCSTANVTY